VVDADEPGHASTLAAGTGTARRRYSNAA
jgi:hypothetical protein